MDFRRKLYLIGFISLLLVLTSCRNNDDGSSSPTAQSPATADNVQKPAKIDQIEILVSESIPPQARIKVLGNLPNNCSLIDEIIQTRGPAAFNIQITTSERLGPECGLDPVSFQEFVTLNVTGLAAGTYAVDVNGVGGSFILLDAPLAGPSAVISGRVWHDLCATSDSNEASTLQISPGCAERDDGSVFANGAIDPDEPGIEGLLVRLGEGNCPATGLAVTITDEDGLYLFSGVPSGEYCISIDATMIQNMAILETGAWSHDNEGDPDYIALTLADGENRSGVNFGWDYAFLPTRGGDSSTCTNRAKLIEDVTIPDDFQVAPGAVFSKTWRLINSGTCSWSPDYNLVLVDGDKLNTEEVIQVIADVTPGETIDLTAQLTAPFKPGTYRGEWMLRDSDGRLFGFGTLANKPIWFQIVVSE
jgi:hypothetical protein